MAWLFLGVVAIPFAALAYLAFDRLAPRLLQPLPEPATDAPGDERLASSLPGRRRLSLSARQLTLVRAGAAVLVLALIAIFVSRRPAGIGAPAAPPAIRGPAESQLPPPMPLQVQLRSGGDGSGPGQFHGPRDIAVDASGNVYVADTGNKRVVKLRPNGSDAGLWASSAKGAFREPSSLAAARDGVIVDDSEAAQLHKFDFNGQAVAAFEHDLGLAHPRGISVGPDGVMYVGDTANSRILRLAPDGSSLGAFDTRGVKLEQPTGVAVDDQGGVYSIEPAASRIQKFTAEGILQASYFLPGTVTVTPPRAAWIAGRGLVVSLPDQNELLTYGPAGVPQATFVPQPDTSAPASRRPLGVAAAPDGASIWVVWNATSNVTQLVWPF